MTERIITSGTTGATATLRLQTSLQWLTEGTDRFLATAEAIPDEWLGEPTLLPGWDRRTLLAHVARNAGALQNLVSWARTGIEIPMYADAAQRATGIAELAAEPPAVIRAELASSAAGLHHDLAHLPADRWSQTVRTARGRPIPASEIPWMRDREVWVHLVDLDAGVTFGGVPPAVRLALLDDAAELMATRPEAVAVRARDAASGREWSFGPSGGAELAGGAALAGGAGPSGRAHPSGGAELAGAVGPAGDQVVVADTMDLCAWVLGRTALLPPGGDWPVLPPWL